MYGANVPSRCCKGIVKCTGKALGMYGIKLLQMYGTRYKGTVAGTGKVLTQLYKGQNPNPSSNPDRPENFLECRFDE